MLAVCDWNYHVVRLVHNQNRRDGCKTVIFGNLIVHGRTDLPAVISGNGVTFDNRAVYSVYKILDKVRGKVILFRFGLFRFRHIRHCQVRVYLIWLYLIGKIPFRWEWLLTRLLRVCAGNRLFVDGVLDIAQAPKLVTALLPRQIAVRLQLLKRGADGIHAVLADAGESFCSVSPTLWER